MQLINMFFRGKGGGGLLPTMAYTGRLRPKGVPFFRLQVYKRVAISQVEAYKREGNRLFHNVN